MGRYIATRILTAAVTIFGVATIVFVLMHLIPGGIVEALAGPAVSQRPELVERIRATAARMECTFDPITAVSYTHLTLPTKRIV